MFRIILLGGLVVSTAWAGIQGWSLATRFIEGEVAVAALVAPAITAMSASRLAPAAADGQPPSLIKTPVLLRGPSLQNERTPPVVTVNKDSPILRPRVPGHGWPMAEDKYDRARQLQRELTRVGCYAGDADGDWGGASKRSMQAFLDKMNANLPVDEPDGFLLAMVRNQTGAVCGDTCRAGEAVGRDGRCIPTALVAQSNQTGKSGRATVAPQPVTSPPPPGPLPMLTAAPTPWRTHTVAERQEPPTPPSAGPLAGRMALGAPLPAAEDTATSLTGRSASLAVPLPPGEAARPIAARPVTSPPQSRPKPKNSSPMWARAVFPDLFVGR